MYVQAYEQVWMQIFYKQMYIHFMVLVLHVVNKAKEIVVFTVTYQEKWVGRSGFFPQLKCTFFASPA